jgi:hypothetical protein
MEENEGPQMKEPGLLVNIEEEMTQKDSKIELGTERGKKQGTTREKKTTETNKLQEIRSDNTKKQTY